jgi:Fic family protein
LVNYWYIHTKIAEFMYIHLLKEWPLFTWDADGLLARLGEVRYLQGRVYGQMNGLGFKIKETAMLDTLTLDVTKSSEIEGELLDAQQVRSSIARRLGMDTGGAVTADRNIEGVVEMLLDATQGYEMALTEDRLFGWHAALFPTGRSGMHKITTGGWRRPEGGAMQVVSGPMGKEQIHFEAPDAERLGVEMAAFAHLWFVTIHPFDDGNGRIARAITDMQLARADNSPQRFYSMSAQMLRERVGYYNHLERTQKGSMDVTGWLKWFLDCMYHSLEHTEQTLNLVLSRNFFWERNRETVLNSRQRQMIDTLLDGFFGKLTSSKWAKMTKTSADTALRDIQDLIDKGVLEKEPGSGRSTSYILIAPKE